MEGYIGEEELITSETPYAHYTQSDWAMYWIECYGLIDGAHHKQWVIDQVARILKGTTVKVKIARWENGHSEYRFVLNNPSKEYLDWAEEMGLDEDEIGIAP